MVRLLNNVLRDPGNMKFRSIRLSNPKIESKLLPANGAFEVLFSVGFEEGDDSLILPLSANMTTVTKFKEAIETVMGGARAVGGASSSRGAASSSGGAAPAVTRDMPRQPQLQPIDVPAGASTDFFNNMVIIFNNLQPFLPFDNLNFLHFLPLQKSQNDFMMTLERELQHVQSYEDPNAQAEAKKLVPIERLESQAKEKFEVFFSVRVDVG